MSESSDLIRELLHIMKSIFPPLGNNPKAERRWRWSISLSMALLLVSFLLNVAIAYGILPPLWYAPEEQMRKLSVQTDSLAAQMKAVAQDVDMTLKLDLGKEMRDNQSNRCTATSNGLKQSLSNILDGEEQYYYRRFGVYYQLPDCSQL